MLNLLCRGSAAAMVLLALGAAPASAAPMRQVTAGNPLLILVSGGCGLNGWRGPGGGCRSNGYARWHRADGWYVHRLGNGGCPPGYWRGPWGNCRDTPYHGRLPGGGYKP